MWAGWGVPIPGADVGGASPVTERTWDGGEPIAPRRDPLFEFQNVSFHALFDVAADPWQQNNMSTPPPPY